MAKRGRRLTREEKSCLIAQGHDAKQFMFLEDVNESYFKAVHKETKKVVIADKYHKAKNRFDY